MEFLLPYFLELRVKNRIVNLSQQYYTRHKRFPPLELLMRSLGLNKKGLLILLRELEHEKIIRRHGSRYYLSEWFAPKIVPQEKRVNKIRKVKQKKDLTSLTLGIVFLLMSIGSIGFSIYYSDLYLGSFMPGLPGMGLSILFVSCASVGFLTSRILWNRGHPPIGVIMGFLGTSAMIFSMFCTVSGLYNLKHKDRVVNLQVDQNIESRSELKILYNNQIDNNQGQIDQKQKDINIWQGLVAQFSKDEISEDTDKNKEYRVLLWKIGNAENDIRSLEESKIVAENSLKELLVNKEGVDITRDETIFEWLSRFREGLSADALEFLINLFPVLFIDILATFGPLVCSIFFEKVSN